MYEYAPFPFIGGSRTYFWVGDLIRLKTNTGQHFILKLYCLEKYIYFDNVQVLDFLIIVLKKSDFLVNTSPKRNSQKTVKFKQKVLKRFSDYVLSILSP